MCNVTSLTARQCHPVPGDVPGGRALVAPLPVAGLLVQVWPRRAAEHAPPPRPVAPQPPALAVRVVSLPRILPLPRPGPGHPVPAVLLPPAVLLVGLPVQLLLGAVPGEVAGPVAPVAHGAGAGVRAAAVATLGTLPGEVARLLAAVAHRARPGHRGLSAHWVRLEVWRGGTLFNVSLRCCQVNFCYIDNLLCLVCCWCNVQLPSIYIINT